MELLENFKFVKVELLTSHKAKFFSDIKEGFEEMQQIRVGKLKGIPAKELLDEV